MRPGCARTSALGEQRAQGKPGARCTRSLVCKGRKHTSSHHRFTGTPGLPCAMVLTVSFALSPVIGLICHRRQRSCLRRLDAGVEASGPHDFAVREPVLSSAAPSASTASRPASVTIAKRPSDRGGTCVMYCCFYPSAKQNIFRNRAGHKIAKRARRANQPAD